MEKKILAFTYALSDELFKDEDDPEASSIEPHKLQDNREITQDIYCMLMAIHTIITRITGDDSMDVLDSIAFMNRIAFQYAEKNSIYEQ